MHLLKEWAIVCRALDQGRQIFIARKGGIAEEEGEFSLTARDFFLFPGYLHQNKEALKPAVHLELDLIAGPEPTDRKIHLRNFARVTDSWRVQNFNLLRALDTEHIWNEGMLRKRFEWGSEIGLTVVVLRVYRLFEEIVLPMKKEYGGCRSWVEVKERISIPQMMPVLSDGEFAQKRSYLQRILSGSPLPV